MSSQLIPEEKRFTRYHVNLAMQAFFSHYNVTDKKVLSISGRPPYLPECDCTTTYYPSVDVTNLPYASETFDLVLSSFVIEHVFDPLKAVDEKYRVLKPGGVAITITNGLYPYHGEGNGGDYWRFTTDGMKLLTHRFSQTRIDFAGNELMVKMLLECKGKAWEGNLSTDFPGVLAKLQKKDHLWQIVVWAISTK
jgi:SAM-dependent methyltransferase